MDLMAVLSVVYDQLAVPVNAGQELILLAVCMLAPNLARGNPVHDRVALDRERYVPPDFRSRQ